MLIPSIRLEAISPRRTGARSVFEPRDEPYGDRASCVTDAFGNMWWIGTHVEDVPPAEMERRVKAAASAP